MAKRFIDTGTFRTGFLRSLPPEYKLFYLYLLCECDHCGIWSVEIDVAELRIGAKIDLNQARKYFQNQVIEFEDGQKWFIPGFISFQYGSIDEQRNKIHQSIYNTLNTNNLLQYLNSINEGLPNPSVTVTEPFPKGEVTPKYKYKDKEKDKDKDKEKEKPKIESLDLVFDEVEILDHELIEWVKKECPDVAKMKEPLTNEQAANLETEYSIDDLKEILLGTKIRDLQDANGLISLLIYLYALLGIKQDKMPTQEQSGVMIDFIKLQMGSYTLDDIKTAFILAISGKLDVDANAYQNFNCEYIGKIMTAYEKMRLSAFVKFNQIEQEKEKEQEKMSWTDEKIKQMNHEFLLECIVKPWKYYLKTGTLTFGVHPNHILYKTLSDELGLIKLTNEEKFEIWNRAKELSKDEVYKQTFNATEINKIKFLKDQIRLIGYDKAMDSTIRNIAYDISIKETFAKFKSDNFDVEQYILDWIKKDSNE